MCSPKGPLVSKLVDLNLDNHVLVWIHNYLAHRHQRVTVNGVTSEPSRVTSGVPQGSILGPLLFLIYIDDITKVTLSQGSKLVLYADDILLYRPICTSEDYFVLQQDIDSISKWTSINFMTFNCDKCKFMLVSRKKSNIPSQPLYLNESLLESVSTFKYLGILLSSDLTWSKHVQSICSKARKLIGLLYRRYYQYSDCDTLLQLYLSLIRPHTEYAVPVWDPHLQNDISSLENLQKFALRVCSKQWNTGYSELLNLCNVSSLENRRLYLKLCHLFKIINNLCYFPPRSIVPKTTRTYTSRSLMLQQPFCRTTSYYNSFIPDSVRTWNYLPEEVVMASSLNAFKKSLRVFT